MERPERQAVRTSLEDVGFASLVDLLSTYAGHAEDVRGWLEGAEINRDRNLRLQYLAGMQPNLYEGGRIYNEIVSYRQPFGDRVIAVHVKDGTLDPEAVKAYPPADQVPAGQGAVPLAEALAAASALEVAIVEFDHFDGDLFDAVEQSRVFLDGTLAETAAV